MVAGGWLVLQINARIALAVPLMPLLIIAAVESRRAKQGGYDVAAHGHRQAATGRWRKGCAVAPHCLGGVG